MSADSFIDSNVLLYLLSTGAKADRAEEVVAQDGVLSVQVLNELANVCRKKLRMQWAETEDFLRVVRDLYPHPQPLTRESHELGMGLAARYGLSVYDGQIAACALLAGCTTLWSEGMKDGLVLDGRTTVRNPFAGLA